MACNPKECYVLQERIAIMQYDGKRGHRAESGAVNSECRGCKRRDKRGSEILKQIKEK